MRRKKIIKRLVLFLPFWLLIIAMFTGLIIIQAASYMNYRRELDRATAELLDEQKAYEKLQDEILYYDSDAYIEQIARDQLGYVKPDEFVFINVAD